MGRFTQWLARPGVHTFEMPAGTRYTRVAQSLVDAAANHKEVMRLKHLVKQAMAAATAADRILILPGFDCASPWIHTSETNRLGIEDHRVVIAADGRCYPAPAGWNSCFPGVHFAYPFMALGEGAQVEELSAVRVPLRREALRSSDAVLCRFPPTCRAGPPRRSWRRSALTIGQLNNCNDVQFQEVPGLFGMWRRPHLSLCG